MFARRCCLAQAQILSVSCDPRLLVARHKALERAGFEVTSLANTFEALDVLENRRFAAVVVGHSFPFTEKQLFAADVGERWRIPVIVLHDGNADIQITADRIQTMEGACELVATLNASIYYSIYYRQRRLT